jgi:hypothetical protein
MKKQNTQAEAHKLKLKAQKKIKYLNEKEEFSYADQLILNEAEQDIAIIDESFKPKNPVERGFGGEIVPPADRKLNGMSLTVKNNNTTTAIDASIERIELADRCGVYNLAFDAAEAIQTQNPIEQMLVHQMTAAHKHSMEVLAKSTEQIDPNVTAKLLNASARLMEAYQKGVLTIHKLRKSDEQKILVQHVNVSDNAQAIINGGAMHEKK